MENCPGFWVKHFFFFFAGVCPLSPGWPIAVGSAFPICSIYCMFGNLFLTFNFKKTSLLKADLGKCKSRFACRNRYIWTCVSVQAGHPLCVSVPGTGLSEQLPCVRTSHVNIWKVLFVISCPNWFQQCSERHRSKPNKIKGFKSLIN